jgi:hypothetical protein
MGPWKETGVGGGDDHNVSHTLVSGETTTRAKAHRDSSGLGPSPIQHKESDGVEAAKSKQQRENRVTVEM